MEVVLFSATLRTVELYTRPVIFSQLRFGGQTTSGVASFIVINEEGWIVTAAHVIDALRAKDRDSAMIEEYQQRRKNIEEDSSLSHKQRRKHLGELPKDDAWVQAQAIMWGSWLKSTIVDVVSDSPADIAIGRISPFDPAWTRSQFAVFKDPAEQMPTGTSLCRLGHPFHNIEADYDVDTQTFSLRDGCLPIPSFPNDGIHTRLIQKQMGQRRVKIIETSTPGLKGQSGGPIFDRHGHVWAIQSQTQHLQLGFSPSLNVNGKEIVEHQFMHVGWGTHVQEVLALLSAHGVRFALSSHSAPTPA